MPQDWNYGNRLRDASIRRVWTGRVLSAIAWFRQLPKSPIHRGVKPVPLAGGLAASESKSNLHSMLAIPWMLLMDGSTNRTWTRAASSRVLENADRDEVISPT
jgi:hypothetical protein